MKLTTEWTTWIAYDGYTELRGAADYVAVTAKYEGKWQIRVYSRAVAGHHGTNYSLANDVSYDVFDSYLTRKEAVEACEQLLLAVGLIDPMWWVTQCPEE